MNEGFNKWRSSSAQPWSVGYENCFSIFAYQICCTVPDMIWPYEICCNEYEDDASHGYQDQGTCQSVMQIWNLYETLYVFLIT